MRTAMSWLDVKLGLRMLARYPALSLAGGFGIAVVIVCGTAAGVFDAVVNGTLPFEQGDRVVAIENWDTGLNEAESQALHDLDAWRSQLTTIENIGAYRLITRNVTVPGRSAEPVRIAEISAAAFRVARVPPLLGRYLVAEDERESASPVMVLGHDEWRRRFGGDRQVIGRTLLISDTTFTVVGIMPDGFGFPVRENYWVPLRLKPASFARGEGPPIFAFGRLADHADLVTAQSELTVVGQRAAADFPDTHARLRPRVLPYTHWFFAEMHDGETLAMRVLIALLLGIVGANVGVLVYARTAARRAEIALRSALGASRQRIVGQMFAEGLVLSVAAGAVGLAIALIARGQLNVLIDQAPFWVNTGLTSGPVIGYAVCLTVLGAVIIGVLPGLQATSRRAQTGLQQATTTLSSWRVGRTYTVLIIVQVALAVAILPVAVSSTWMSIRYAVADTGFPADEFLTARIAMDREVPSSATVASDDQEQLNVRFRDRQAELVRRLRSEPAVSDVTVLIDLPGDEPRGRIEIEGDRTIQVGVGELGADFDEIGVDFLQAFDVPLLAGRMFNAGDLDAASRHVIVNQMFAQQFLGGNAVGRRVRERGSTESGPGPWLEVAGVIGTFPPTPIEAERDEAALYRPVSRGAVQSVFLALRIREDEPTGFAGRLREIATAVDGSLQLDEIRSMDALLREQQTELRIAAWSIGLVTASVLLLSAIGLHALMAFTVTQRRRDIGIRVSLGATSRQIVGRIVSRAMWQLTIGIVIGVAIAAQWDLESEGELTGDMGLVLFPAVAAFVLLVGFIAAAGPARRGLRIQPMEALKEQ